MAQITVADIKKLRDITQAGMMDCKKALMENDGDFEKAIADLRKKGLKVASKREDRDAAEGCVIGKANGKFAVVIALKCETDFVAKNGDFVKFANDILDIAINNDIKCLDCLKNQAYNNGTIQDEIVNKTGVIGEKIELDFARIDAEDTICYNHLGNRLSAMVGFSKAIDEQAKKNIAMQVAAMNPLYVTEAEISQEAKDNELAVNIEKSKAEQVQRQVEVALKKAGINPAHVDSEEHMESNMAKGWITAEQVEEAKKIIAEVGESAKAAIKDEQIQKIAAGRLNKWYEEVCLMNQKYEQDNKLTIKQYVQSIDKDATIVTFKRYSLS